MTNAKFKPPAKPLFYLGIDGTNSIDTVVWGHLWNARFGWKNLLWELDKDAADKQRRIDSAHPLLPILREIYNRGGNIFADTLIMPEGTKGKGVDPKWPSQTDRTLNVAAMNQGVNFMRTFILSPGVDSKKLNDTGTGVVANIVFVSSHGTVVGDMFGETSYKLTNVDLTFSVTEAAILGKKFAGPDWLILSNCYTVTDNTQNDWMTLMSGPRPLRGILGFQNVCPFPEPSADIFARFITHLEKGKTLVQSFREACTAFGVRNNWAVLCHENAAGDIITDWNVGSLKPLNTAPAVFKMFNEATPAGVVVTFRNDPFEAFWSKGGTRITPHNRNAVTSKMAVGDTVTLTVKPPPPATNFTAGTKIRITLIYIRVNYPQAINVTKMFNVKAQTGASAPTTSKQNGERPTSVGPDDGHDTWDLTVTSAPAEVTLELECVNLDLDKHGQHNVPYWVRVALSTLPDSFDFARNGSILLK